MPPPNNMDAILTKRFELYRLGTDYQLSSLQAFQALANDLQPLYTVAMEELLRAFTIGNNTEPFVELDEAIIHNASGSTPTGGVVGKLYLRQSVAEKLYAATQWLQQVQPTYALWVTDGYRPLTLQRQHFLLITKQLEQQGFSGETLYQRTCQLISDPDVFPPHSTGGTVDLTIYDRRTSQPIDMGTVVDSIETPLIHTWCSTITQQQRENRMLLYTAMTAVGFANIPLEWWHYSYGDLEWALHTGTNATLYEKVETLPTTI